MDPRIAELINKISNKTEFEKPEFISWKDQIMALHLSVPGEADKVRLIELYNALMRVVISNVEAAGGEAEPIEKLRQGEYVFFLMKEAMIGDNVDPDRMAYLTRREVAAGRMNPNDSLVALADAGSQVLGSGGRSTTPKNGFWKRLFN